MSKHRKPNCSCGECPRHLAYKEVSAEADKRIEEHCTKVCTCAQNKTASSNEVLTTPDRSDE